MANVSRLEKNCVKNRMYEMPRDPSEIGQTTINKKRLGDLIILSPEALTFNKRGLSWKFFTSGV